MMNMCLGQGNKSLYLQCIQGIFSFIHFLKSIHNNGHLEKVWVFSLDSPLKVTTPWRSNLYIETVHSVRRVGLKIRVSLVQILVSAPIISRGYSFLAVTPFFVYGRSMIRLITPSLLINIFSLHPRPPLLPAPKTTLYLQIKIKRNWQF